MLVSTLQFLFQGFLTAVRVSLFLALLSRCLKPEMVIKYLNFVLGGSYLSSRGSVVSEDSARKGSEGDSRLYEKVRKLDASFTELDDLVRDLRVEEIKQSIEKSQMLSDRARQSAERMEQIETEVLDKIRTVQEDVEKSLHNLRTKFIPIQARALAEETSLKAREAFDERVKKIEEGFEQVRAGNARDKELLAEFQGRMEEGLRTVGSLEQNLSTSFQARVARLEESLGAKVGAATQVAQEAKHLAAELNLKVSSLPDRTAALEAGLREQGTAREQLAQDLVGVRSDLAALKSGDLEALAVQLQGLTPQVAALQGEVDAMPEQLKALLGSMLSPLITQFGETTAAFGVLDSNLRALQASLAEVRDRTIDTEALNAKLQQMAGTQDAAHSALSEDLTRGLASADRRTSEVEQKLTSLEHRVQLLQSSQASSGKLHHVDPVLTRSPRTSSIENHSAAEDAQPRDEAGTAPSSLEEAAPISASPLTASSPRRAPAGLPRVTPPSSPAPKPPLSPVPRSASPGNLASSFARMHSPRRTGSGGIPVPQPSVARALSLDPATEKAVDEVVESIIPTGNSPSFPSTGFVGSLPYALGLASAPQLPPATGTPSPSTLEKEEPSPTTPPTISISQVPSGISDEFEADADVRGESAESGDSVSSEQAEQWSGTRTT